MRNTGLKIDILADELRAMLSLPSADINTALTCIVKEFPNLSVKEAAEVLSLINAIISKEQKEKIEVVITAPVSFDIAARRTDSVIEELILNAKRHIVITGYVISGYFEKMIKLLNQKSKQGIVVELFLNDYENVKHHLKNIDYLNSNYFHIYKHIEQADKMASLHAKTIIVDREKMLISSANLSYCGMVSNVEVGLLAESKNKCRQVLEIYNKLIKERVFMIHK